MKLNKFYTNGKVDQDSLVSSVALHCKQAAKEVSGFWLIETFGCSVLKGK